MNTAALSKNLLTLAPTLSALLLGPMAGTAVTALEGAFGLSPGSGSDAITAVMAGGGMTPLIINNVRAADQKHAEVMAGLQVDVAKINADQEKTDAGDRDSARARQVQMRDRTPANMAYLIIGAFFVVSMAQLVALIFYPESIAKVPPEGWLLVGTLTGYFAQEAKAASSFFFGTTSDSKTKTEALVDIAKAP